MEKIGIIGYGAMGSALAERLVNSAGIKPMVFDVAVEARRRAVEDGLEVASSAAELGEKCDLIDVIVRTDDEMVDATIGTEGAARNARAGTVLLLHSSVLPVTTFAIANAVASSGVEVADACAAGKPEDIRAGKLVFLLGATKELAERVSPHLVRMADHVLHMGPLGAGNVAKLMKNLVTGSQRLVVWEALRIGESAGISYINALEMMRLVMGEHPDCVQRWEHAFDPSGNDVLPWCGTNLYHKDIPLAATLGRSYGLELPIAEQLAESASLLIKLNEGREWTGAQD